MKYEEYFFGTSTIELYCEILLGVLRYTSIKDKSLSQVEYDAALSKRLRFNSEDGWMQLRSCVDQLEDAQYAVEEVRNRGLITNIEFEHGEKYLRLYGVLNACWLQCGAIIDLLKLFNLLEQKSRIDKLKKTKVINLRTKIASHTTSYTSVGDKSEKLYFRLSQPTISKWGQGMNVISGNGLEYIDLFDCLDEFKLIAEGQLYDIVEHIFRGRIFKTENLKWMMLRFEFIKEHRQAKN